LARQQAREAAMQLVFEQLFGGEGKPETLVDLTDYTPDSNDLRFIEEMVSGVDAHLPEIDSTIASCLRGWTIERLARVDLAVLRLAVYEMEYAGTPAPVVISEAVEMTRKYSREESCPFVNGVLGTIHRKQAQK